MKSSTHESELGGAKHRSTLRDTARKAAMVAVGVSLLGSGIAFSATQAQGAPKPPEPQVKVCHAGKSTSNPYTQDTVDQSSIFDGEEVNGHGLHTGPLFNLASGKDQPAWGDIIPEFGDYPGLNDSEAGLAILENDCNVPGASDASLLVTVCLVDPIGGSPYKQQTFRRDEIVNKNGQPKPNGPADTGIGLYPAEGYGNIVPLIPESDYPTTQFPGVNNTGSTAEAILAANCNWNRTSPSPEPTPTVTVTTPGTNTTTTVTVPGPTVTVTATPTPTASAVPPVAVAPVVTPSVAPSRVPPVAVAPVAESVPTAVNAGDGSSQDKPMSPMSIALLALAGIGVVYSALKLSTRRRSTSSH